MNNAHDKYAPCWAIILVILMITGLSTLWYKEGSFWNGYILDMVGPAWTYILFRGLFTTKADNIWTRFFRPTKTLIILLVVVYGIEILQYFKVYYATFDPLDIVAYSSILVPIFIIDLFLTRKEN